MGYKIAPFELCHADRVAMLLKQLSSRKAKFEPKELIADCHCFPYVMLAKTEVVGFGILSGHANAMDGLGKGALLEDMVIDKQYRRQGLGSVLTIHLKNLAEAFGIEMLFLKSDLKDERLGARAAYNSLGFHEIGNTGWFYLELQQ